MSRQLFKEFEAYLPSSDLQDIYDQGVNLLRDDIIMIRKLLGTYNIKGQKKSELIKDYIAQWQHNIDDTVAGENKGRRAANIFIRQNIHRYL